MIFKKIIFLLFFLALFFNINMPVSAKEIKIIISPIDVSGAGENQYLGSSISQMLISRMNKPGEIFIYEAKTLFPKETKKHYDNFSNHLNIARKNNADYLITGKVLSSGKNCDIDLFLFNISTNQPESHFNYSSENLNDLIPKLNDFSKSSANLVKYIKISEEKSSEKNDKTSENYGDNKPVLLSPGSAESAGGDDSYRIHPDKLMRTGKAQQKIIDEKKKTIIEKKQMTSEELASKPALIAPSKQQDEKDKKQGVLSKIGIDFHDEKINPEKAAKKPELFIERQTLVSNISMPEANNTVDSSKPVLLSPGASSKSLKSFSFYLPYFNKNDTPFTRSGLPFPTPEELKPVGKIKKDEESIFLRKDSNTNKNDSKINYFEKKEIKNTVSPQNLKKTDDFSKSINNNHISQKNESNKPLPSSNDNSSKTDDSMNAKQTVRDSEKTSNPQWQWY